MFVGPFEHHSNLLPWRELGASTIAIDETSEGLVDLLHLEHELKVWPAGFQTAITVMSSTIKY